MKIKLSVSDECIEEVTQFLTERGIELDDDADFVLIQRDKYVSHLAVRLPETGQRRTVAVNDIITIESYGHTVEVHTLQGVFVTSDRLYQLMCLLDPEQFLRINHSVIAAKNKIKAIHPSLSMKFTLTMVNDRRVDVTRTYYNSFKEAFHL